MTKLHFRGWPSQLTRRQAKKRRLLAGRPKNTARFVERLEQRALLSAVTVNTISDTDAVAPATSPNDSSGSISLRSAIEYLDANGGGAVDFAAALYASGPATITLGGTELAITQAMTITGPGASLMTIDGNYKSRIFDVDDGYGTPDVNVAIEGLTLTNGSVTGTADAAALGGAVYNADNLTLTGDMITGNKAQGGGGAANSDNPNGGAADGGGIFSTGSLILTDDKLIGNVAEGVQVFTSGAGGPGAGGAIYSTGSVVLTDDTLRFNIADGGDGRGSAGNGGDAAGGGIYSTGGLVLTNDTLFANYVTAGSGDGRAGNFTAGGVAAGGGVYSTQSAVLTNDTLSGNSVFGGDCVALGVGVPGSTGGAGGAGDGGGIYSTGGLVLTNDNLCGNSVHGGIDNRGIVARNAGGGIEEIGHAVSLANTLLIANYADTSIDLDGSLSANSAGNIVGLPAGETISQLLATDDNIHPLLANNGGPTETIALAAGSPAIGAGAPLATLSGAVTDATNTSISVSDATFLAVGDALNVDGEIVLVTAVDSTNNTITVTRGADDTTAATHASGTGLFLAFDQRGLPRNANPDIGAFETQLPTVNITVQNASQVYTGAADPVSADVVGLSSATIATSPAADINFAYYTGTLTAGQIAGATPLTGVPVNVGIYTVVANFNSDVAGYRDASSLPAYFTITNAAVTYQIGDAIQGRGVAADLAKVLGATIPTGVDHETLTIAYSSVGDTASAPLGQYSITGTVSNGSGLASNYTVTLKPGMLTVDYPAGVGYLAGVPGDGTPQTFVRNLYRELLGREPSAGDLAYWAAQVQADSSVAGREQVISFFMNSPEYKAHYVDTLYEVFLGRAPDAAGLAFWSAKMGDPGTPGEHGGSADERFILAAIVGSDEFYAQAGGTDQGFVQALYHDLLGRAGDAADVNTWAGLVHSQEQDRDGIVRNFLSAAETEHKLLDNFFPAQGGTAANPLPVPGTAAPVGNDDLAIATGLGWENLYLQGPYGNAPAANDVFFNSLAGGAPWDDVRLLLLASDQFYTNSNRPVTE